MWSVYENGKPAIRTKSCWSQYQYETLEEAAQYLKDWARPYFYWVSIAQIIKLCATRKPYNYNGYGDTFEITYTED